MTAALWYVGGPDSDDREELRYSLRSVAANAPQITEAWVVGDVPAWFAGARMPLEPKSEKFANARNSITRFTDWHGAPERFWLFMDDIFVTEPVDDLPICHLGPVVKYSTYTDRSRQGTYARAVRDTADCLIDHGHAEPLAYLAHAPVLLDTAKVREFLDAYPAHLSLEPYLLYVVAGLAGPGQRTGNAKCSTAETFEHKRDLDIPYLSSNPDVWPGCVADYVKPMFPDASRWELP